MSIQQAPIAIVSACRWLGAGLALLLALTRTLAIAAGAESMGGPGPTGPSMDRSTEERILALAPDHITAADVRDALARSTAPRIVALQGSVALVTMRPFAEFLIAMGYPETRLADPRDGSLSRPSSGSSAQLAGELAWYYEQDGLMPMLIGHSQGGMLAIKVLHELAGAFAGEVEVWNPLTDSSEHRTSIRDPRDGTMRPVVGLKLAYVAALATGKLPRLLLGQWTMIEKLRRIPDSVEEFSGYTIEWDPIAGTFPGSEPYRATGSAQVRNITLGVATGHIAMPRVDALALDPVTRAWIEQYRPDEVAAPPAAAVDTSNIVHAADIWFSVKKHWCIELQRLIRARRALAGGGA